MFTFTGIRNYFTGQAAQATTAAANLNVRYTTAKLDNIANLAEQYQNYFENYTQTTGLPDNLRAFDQQNPGFLAAFRAAKPKEFAGKAQYEVSFCYQEQDGQCKEYSITCGTGAADQLQVRDLSEPDRTQYALIPKRFETLQQRVNVTQAEPAVQALQLSPASASAASAAHPDTAKLQGAALALGKYLFHYTRNLPSSTVPENLREFSEQNPNFLQQFRDAEAVDANDKQQYRVDFKYQDQTYSLTCGIDPKDTIEIRNISQAKPVAVNTKKFTDLQRSLRAQHRLELQQQAQQAVSASAVVTAAAMNQSRQNLLETAQLVDSYLVFFQNHLPDTPPPPELKGFFTENPDLLQRFIQPATVWVGETKEYQVDFTYQGKNYSLTSKTDMIEIRNLTDLDPQESIAQAPIRFLDIRQMLINQKIDMTERNKHVRLVTLLTTEAPNSAAMKADKTPAAKTARAIDRLLTVYLAGKTKPTNLLSAEGKLDTANRDLRKDIAKAAPTNCKEQTTGNTWKSYIVKIDFKDQTFFLEGEPGENKKAVITHELPSGAWDRLVTLDFSFEKLQTAIKTEVQRKGKTLDPQPSSSNSQPETENLADDSAEHSVWTLKTVSRPDAPPSYDAFLRGEY